MENHFTEPGEAIFLAPSLLVYFTESAENHFPRPKKLLDRVTVAFSRELAQEALTNAP